MWPQIEGKTQDGVLTYRYAGDVRQAWPIVLPGVQKIRDCNGEPWIPEDVYASIVTGRAALYTFEDEHGIHAGFGVYEVMPMAYESNPALNIWLGHSERPDYGHYGVELSRLIAGHMGLDRIVFSTTQDSPWVRKRGRLLKAYYEVI